MGEDLARCSVADGLVGAEAVAGPLPVEELLIKPGIWNEREVI